MPKARAYSSQIAKFDTIPAWVNPVDGANDPTSPNWHEAVTY